jgi:hypothetical protein
MKRPLYFFTEFSENVFQVVDFPSSCGESPAAFPDIFYLRLLQNFPGTARRRSCSRDRKIFPAWRNVKYQNGRGAKCTGTSRGLFHS